MAGLARPRVAREISKSEAAPAVYESHLLHS